jgi:exodeoxyribonuclease VII large subunit
MSKEQLGWEHLLNDLGATASDSAEPESVAKSAPQSAHQNGPEAKNAVCDREPKEPAAKRKKPVPAMIVAETQYAKKNWAKLEFKGSTSSDAKDTKRNAKTDAQPAMELPAKLGASSDENLETKAPPVSQSAASPSLDPLITETESVESSPQVLSVSSLNKNIREILEGRFPILWLRGEISNFKAHTSGHFYFSLKDAKAQIGAVMFRGFNSQLKFRPEDGMEVIVRGKITVYEPRGNYQIFCETMEPVGAGALQKAFEQLKARLEREGLFDASTKRPVPQLPKHIAIVTSPTGAAIRDMLNVLGRRFKGAHITVVPCKVQGDQAPAEIVAAIGLVNRLNDVDVMIVGRGGGSIEDLWAFNDERVARAIKGSRVPTISAVGHEIDFTIADFVADLRAPTPSAAAELVVKNAADLIERVILARRALRYGILRRLNSAREISTATAKRLVDPQRRIQDASIRCDELLGRLENGVRRGFQSRQMRIEILRNRMGTPLGRLATLRETASAREAGLKSAMRHFLRMRGERLARLMAVLDSLSPLKVLERGYSMTTIKGKILADAAEADVGSQVRVQLGRGAIEANVTKVER